MRYLSLLVALTWYNANAQLVLPKQGPLEVKGNLLHWVDTTNTLAFEQVQEQHFEVASIPEEKKRSA